ncbi:hypothetical protein ACI2L4_10100 [Streptomyces sparsogenes]|uniref:hypothetical protein n=1 Tax=Streptomyces sparsogenes TaxID=67365 RepID=UPI0038505C17
MHYALKSFSFIAKTWTELLGSQHSSTILAAGNAVGAWRRLPESDALSSGPALIALLNSLQSPGIQSTVRAIRDRVRKLGH